MERYIRTDAANLPPIRLLRQRSKSQPIERRNDAFIGTEANNHGPRPCSNNAGEHYPGGMGSEGAWETVAGSTLRYELALSSVPKARPHRTAHNHLGVNVHSYESFTSLPGERGRMQRRPNKEGTTLKLCVQASPLVCSSMTTHSAVSDWVQIFATEHPEILEAMTELGVVFQDLLGHLADVDVHPIHRILQHHVFCGGAF